MALKPETVISGQPLFTDLVESDLIGVSPTALKELWQTSVKSFKQRRGVLFVSRGVGRFWESHAFPQQSLVRELVDEGIACTWLDGHGWRPYRPHLYFKSNILKVQQLKSLPLSRLTFSWRQSKKWIVKQIEREIKRLGDNPIIWVHDSLDEDVAEQLPYIDIYSVFDNPYQHDVNSALCRKAKLIYCQNSYAATIYSAEHTGKTFRSFPPMDLTPRVFTSLETPSYKSNFPTGRVVGCVGSYFSSEFDYNCLEQIVKWCGDIGFMYVGRTDLIGKARMESLSRHENFMYVPWIPRSRVIGYWKSLDCSLIPYLHHLPQDGAFPTRAIESLSFGTPVIMTDIPKTRDLRDLAVLSSDPYQLLQALRAPKHYPDPGNVEQMIAKMNPRMHLIATSQLLGT
jgi:glycosyltransferase involved in cell wall biosynthesis